MVQIPCSTERISSILLSCSTIMHKNKLSIFQTFPLMWHEFFCIYLQTRFSPGPHWGTSVPQTPSFAAPTPNTRRRQWSLQVTYLRMKSHYFRASDRPAVCAINSHPLSRAVAYSNRLDRTTATLRLPTVDAIFMTMSLYVCSVTSVYGRRVPVLKV